MTLERCGALVKELLARLRRAPVLRSIPAGLITATFVLSVFSWSWNFPSYDLVFVRGQISSNWPGFFKQVNAPFTDHSGHYAEEDHNAKLGFRFVPAVLCKLLGIHDPDGAVALQTIIGILLHGAILLFLRQRTTNLRDALLLALPFTLVAGGHAFAQDLWGFFDGLALLFLTLCACSRHNILRIALLLCACFTDERAFVVSPVLLILDPSTANRWKSFIAVPWLMITWALYVALRVALHHFFGLRTAPIDPSYLLTNWAAAPHALVHGFEGFLILLVLVTRSMLGQRLYRSGIILIGTSALLTLVAISVIDTERSMAYALPILLVATARLLRLWPVDRVLGLFAIITAINLCYSDCWPLPLQIVRMFFVTHTL